MQHILVFGAPGAGSTTFAQELAAKVQLPCHDLEDFFSAPKKEFYPRPQVESETERFYKTLKEQSQWILSGSIALWDTEITELLHGVIYLQMIRTKRLQRLKEREIQKHGEKIADSSTKEFKSFNQYMYWASQFDQGGLERESKILHENWLSKRECPVLRLDASLPLEQSLSTVLEEWF